MREVVREALFFYVNMAIVTILLGWFIAKSIQYFRHKEPELAGMCITAFFMCVPFWVIMLYAWFFAK